MATKSKRKWLWLKFRKDDHGHNMLVAAQRWIHANNGTAIVLGGVGVRDMGEFRYEIVVSATGKKPSKGDTGKDSQ